ncbi:MAG: RNA polymerase sigma factor [Lachnospiraceae bacterium]|nr:RNA polymerase sigma factor [Lachnospiraceae bacterium]
MQDERIVAMYWQRDEAAIRETEKKYGSYLLKIAYNVLFDLEDSKESVNDTYMKAWNSIPPYKPCILSSYLGKITRQLSIDVLRTRNRIKRRASEYAVSLSELEDCISSGDVTEQEVNLHLLADAINSYLGTLSKDARTTFVGRYYYMDSIKEVASYHKMSVPKVKSMLYRTRIGLKGYLKKEGFDT